MASQPITQVSEGRANETPPATHPVLELIRHRLESGSRPGQRTDGATLVLAIEGGGMRGVVSAGMDAALEDLGMLGAFDSVYGASAGAFNGAYLLSDRARVGATIYYEDVNNKQFIDPWRFYRAPILDLNFMLDHVAVRIKPIDWEKVLSSPIPLHVVAFSLARRETVLLEIGSAAEIRDALKASSSIPWVAGEPVRIRDDTYWDASFHDGSIPVRLAHRAGATHVLALLTRPSGVLRGRPNLLERRLIAPHVRKHGRELADIYLSRAESYSEAITEIVAATSHAQGPPYTYGVALGRGLEGVSQLESDRRKLFAGAASGYRAMRRVFDASNFSVAHELRGFHF